VETISGQQKKEALQWRGGCAASRILYMKDLRRKENPKALHGLQRQNVRPTGQSKKQQNVNRRKVIIIPSSWR